MSRTSREAGFGRPHEAWVPLVAGLVWLGAGLGEGGLGLLLAVVPGTLLLATAVAELLWSGDRRILQFCALGAALGVLLALPEMFFLGLGRGLLLGLLAAVSFVAAGQVSLHTLSRRTAPGARLTQVPAECQIRCASSSVS